MRLLELFSGTESISKVFRRSDHYCLTVDLDPQFHPNILSDINEIEMEDLEPYMPFDVVWASPPCETFSVASIGTHWGGGKRAYQPKTKRAIQGMKNVTHTLDLIKQIKPKYWFLENPRGVLRKLPFMQGISKQTITYCQYGDTRMKPTDIFGTIDGFWFRLMCKNGEPCHERAPRGAKTGTQGLKNRIERGRIPSAFCHDLMNQLEDRI